METERYERGFLESQLKKKDERINELCKNRIHSQITRIRMQICFFIFSAQEHRQFLTDIQDLRTELSAQGMEDIPPNDDGQIEAVSLIILLLVLGER